ncbi:MAG: C1 family peptidase, partial [Bacteroidota bacterium]
MKGPYFTTLFLMVFSVTIAQKKAGRAPLNPEFVKFAEQKGKKSESVKGFNTGYYPSPVEFQFNKHAYRDDRKKSVNQLPTSYDLRDSGLITPVKDQNPLGSCWTFSSIGAIESRWIQLGDYSASTLDLS